MYIIDIDNKDRVQQKIEIFREIDGNIPHPLKNLDDSQLRQWASQVKEFQMN